MVKDVWILIQDELVIKLGNFDNRSDQPRGLK